MEHYQDFLTIHTGSCEGRVFDTTQKISVKDIALINAQKASRAIPKRAIPKRAVPNRVAAKKK